MYGVARSSFDGGRGGLGVDVRALSHQRSRGWKDDERVASKNREDKSLKSTIDVQRS